MLQILNPLKTKFLLSLRLLLSAAVVVALLPGETATPSAYSPQVQVYAALSGTVVTLATIIILVAVAATLAMEMRLRRRVQLQVEAQQQKYRQLLESSSFTCWITDLDGNLLEVDGPCKELTGFGAEALLGENYFNIVQSQYRAQAREFFQARLSQSSFDKTIELPMRHKSGERNWTEQNVVVRYQDGKATGFQVITRDITEKKYAENLLQAAEQRMKDKQQEYQERLQSIIDNIPMIIYLKDLEGKFLMVNRVFHEVFKTTDEDVVGRTKLHVHISRENEEKFLQADEDIKMYGKPVEIEDILLTHQGEKHMAVVKFPLLNKNNEMIAIGGVGKDVTESVRYRQQLIEARIRAERAEKLQEEFLANMSHEIRTPMNGIIGMTNLLLTTRLSDEQQEYLHIVRESSNILLSLINDILDLSKIKAGRMTVEQIDFNLPDTVHRLLAPMKVKAAEKGISIHCDIDEGLPRCLRGDQHKLHQVLNNLLSNAVKFTEKGSVTVQVKLLAQANNTYQVALSVADSGIGIAEDNLQMIFDSFTQAGNDMVRRFGGTGLGLAITKRLVELMQGEITVSSQLGVGTTFTCTLPFAAAEVEGAGCREVKEMAATENYSLRGRRILLVEDNLINQKVTERILHKAGMHVVIANHGREAIEILANENFDAILMDLQMTEMDGFQATAFIRERLQLQTPIIAMTASALRDEKRRCLQMGMNQYLTKPFVPQQLFAQLKRLISTSEESLVVEKPALKPGKRLYSLDFVFEMEDDEYSLEILNMFLDSAPATLALLSQRVREENWSEVHRLAHGLKSSLGVLQVHSLLEKMTALEQLAKSGSQPEKMRRLIAASLDHYEVIRPLIEAERQSILDKTNTVSV